MDTVWQHSLEQLLSLYYSAFFYMERIVCYGVFPLPLNKAPLTFHQTLAEAFSSAS